MKLTHRFAVFGLTLVTISACGSNNVRNVSASELSAQAPLATTQTAYLVRNARPNLAPAVGGGFSDFASWKAAFRQRALASGVSAATFDSVEPYMGFKPRVVASDRNQAEFKQTLMQYVDARVSPTRVQLGRDKVGQIGNQIKAIAARYQIDESVLLGIWGMETNYGGFTGDIHIFTALSTLAYEGRRREWAETQLLNALLILQNGDMKPADMVGSWAGGLGHTQFIPEMFNIYVIDANNDGRRNVFDPVEALSSTANFLRNEGWQPGLVWGAEVALPAGFNTALAGKNSFRPASFWRDQGVRAISSRGLPNAELAIYIPEGANGRAFAVTRNFDTIKRYNPSNSYALAVALLGDAAWGYSR